MSKKESNFELIKTGLHNKLTNKQLATIMQTSPGGVYKYLKGEIHKMTETDELIVKEAVKNALYLSATGYYADDVSIVSHYDTKGRPIQNKLGEHMTVAINRRYIKPELSAVKTVLEKLEPEFFQGGEVVQFIDDLEENSSDNKG